MIADGYDIHNRFLVLSFYFVVSVVRFVVDTVIGSSRRNQITLKNWSEYLLSFLFFLNSLSVSMVTILSPLRCFFTRVGNFGSFLSLCFSICLFSTCRFSSARKNGGNEPTGSLRILTITESRPAKAAQPGTPSSIRTGLRIKYSTSGTFKFPHLLIYFSLISFFVLSVGALIFYFFPFSLSDVSVYL